jgi:putative hydrolase of the HAD superfamily
MEIRAVVFDLDETLTDRGRSIDRFVPVFVQRFGGELARCDVEEICRSIRDGDGGGYATREALGAVLQTRLPWKSTPTLENLVAFWREQFPRCNVEREGVTPTLRRLAEMGLKLGVVSNGMVLSQYAKLEAIGIRSLFSAILISEEVGIKKPDPRIFRMALERLGVPANEAVFVGDHPMLDAAAARNVGMRAIWLNARAEAMPPEIARVEMISSIEQVLSL